MQVAPPDLEGRKDIFHLYLDKITLGPDVDVGSLARGTIGFTGIAAPAGNCVRVNTSAAKE